MNRIDPILGIPLYGMNEKYLESGESAIKHAF